MRMRSAGGQSGLGDQCAVLRYHMSMSFAETDADDSGDHPASESDASMVQHTLELICSENRRLLSELKRERESVDVVQKRNHAQTDAVAEQQDRIEKLVSSQVKESRDRARRDRTITKLAAFALAAVVPGGAGSVWLLSRSPSPDEIRLQAKPVLDTVEASQKNVEKRLDDAEGKINRLGHSVIEQQVQISDGFEYIADKIDAAHPRQKGDVDIRDYPTVEAAKKKADAIKMRKGVEDLFNEDGEEWQSP